ncbi:hypothetical protein PV762_17570 [Mitsuaria sp. CC2]|uniref:hypothetical protein n=1 Tax=Mitsuaria sp. CC2 TaxID=3029186 RepID=UPI003B8DEBCD
MAKIIVPALATASQMLSHLQSLVDDEGFVRGVRTEDGWAFEEFVPPPKRSTVDEF